MSNGFVPTPPRVANYMAASVFGVNRPDASSRVLLPGLGTGRLYDAIIRYCTEGEGYPARFSYDIPTITGIEIDPELVQRFRMTHHDPAIDIEVGDFLLDPPAGPFDHVLCNPPYITYNDIPKDQREAYNDRFDVVDGKYDIYYLFFEQALNVLRPGGTLTFLTPDRWMTIGNASKVRDMIRHHHPGEFMALPDRVFDQKVQTMITTVDKLRYDQEPELSTLWVEALYGYEFDYMLPRASEGEIREHWSTYVGRVDRLRTLAYNVEQRDLDRDGGRMFPRIRSFSEPTPEPLESEQSALPGVDHAG